MTDSVERLTAALADRYRIERELGAGGMATVYLAHDRKHDRKVAIKVLKPELAAVLGAERFVQEIKTTAALSHPHILPLFDSGEAGGFLYYVMPYIEGETIRSKLSRETQFGIEEAVRITTAVADALDYAHRHGVIHRDIKPENILLHDGRPMVMDFGIALAVSAAAGGRMTETGLSLGTPHYMSPEQATADREITGRSDIYSLASVLYEMLSGEPPHMGTSAQQIIMKIIAESVQPVAELRKSVPANVAAAVGKALQKLPADRFESAKAFADALTNPSFTTAATQRTGVVVPAASTWWQRLAIPALVLSGVLAAAVAWTLAMRRPAGQQTDGVTRFVIQPPAGYQFSDVVPAISDDGRTIVFAAESAGTTRLWVRPLEAIQAVPLRGTERVYGGGTISPDGAWVVFRQQDRLMRVAIGGDQSPQPVPGAPVMSTIFGPPSVAWQDDGSMILIAEMAEGILRIDPSGKRLDTLRLVRRDSSEQGLMFPVVIPGANALLFGVWTRTGWNLRARALDGSREVMVVPGASRSQFLPPDRVMYSKNGVLYSSRFDVRSLQVSGEVTTIATNLPNLFFGNSHAVHFALSRSGALVHLAGSQQPRNRLALIDRQGGRITALRDSVGTRPRFSPDGRSIVVEDSGHVWIVDLARGGTRSLFSTGGLSYVPVWNADGSRIISSIYDGGPAQLWSFSVNNPADVKRLAPSSRRRYATSFTADGKIMAFYETTPATKADIWLLEGDSARPWLTEAHNEFHPRISPDGRWLAYTSNESGAIEVYIRPFPGGGRPERVSTAGGSAPVWEPHGPDLFFRTGEWIYASRISGSGVAGEPRAVLRVAGLAAGDEISFVFDISPDGRRFIVARAQQGPLDRELQVILNGRSLLNAAAQK